jgi:RND family efflux transporter MFP subunit
MLRTRIRNTQWLALLLCMPLSLPAQVQVRVEPVRLALITEELSISGSVLSPRYSDLSTQESGLVVSLAVETGDRVEQGDVLLELDGELTRLELERLLARQEEARLSFEDARRLADEGRSLIDDRNISKSQYETRLANEAREEAKLRQLNTQVRMQEVKFQRHKLKAPFGGVIGKRHAELGEWLNAGNSSMQLVQMDPLRVEAKIPERYYSEVRAGTPVTIEVDAWPGRPIEAEVEALVAVTDSDTRSFTVRMDIPNPEHLLAPGMSAHLSFRLGGDSSSPVLQVPADAVVRRGDGTAVVWVVRGDIAEAVPVRVGRRAGRSVEVSSNNLGEGELAVTLGNESLRPGQAVTAVRN